MGGPRNRGDIAEWIIRNARRPVYYSVKNNSRIDRAKMVSAGVLYHLLPSGKALDRDGPWQRISYRNLADNLVSARDFGSDNILAEHEFFRALYDLESRRPEEAKAHFARAAAYASGIREVPNNIGSVLAEHGLPEEAIPYFERPVAIDPTYTTALRNIARVCKGLSKWTKAEAALLKLAEASPADFRVFGELGFLGKRTGRPREEIVRRFKQSLRLNPAQPKIIAELARYHTERSGQPVESP